MFCQREAALDASTFSTEIELECPTKSVHRTPCSSNQLTTVWNRPVRSSSRLGATLTQWQRPVAVAEGSKGWDSHGKPVALKAQAVMALKADAGQASGVEG